MTPRNTGSALAEQLQRRGAARHGHALACGPQRGEQRQLLAGGGAQDQEPHAAVLAAHQRRVAEVAQRPRVGVEQRLLDADRRQVEQRVADRFVGAAIHGEHDLLQRVEVRQRAEVVRGQQVGSARRPDVARLQPLFAAQLAARPERVAFVVVEPQPYRLRGRGPHLPFVRGSILRARAGKRRERCAEAQGQAMRGHANRGRGRGVGESYALRVLCAANPGPRPASAGAARFPALAPPPRVPMMPAVHFRRGGDRLRPDAVTAWVARRGPRPSIIPSEN
jgi:hypothetical protein